MTNEFKCRLQFYDGHYWTRGKSYPTIESARITLASFGQRPALKWRILVRVPAGRRVV